MDDTRVGYVHVVCHPWSSMETSHSRLPASARFKLLLTEDDSDCDSGAVIRTHAFERGVLALPGTVFMPSGRKTAHVRASFSLLEPDQVDEALRRLKEAILDARNAAKK